MPFLRFRPSPASHNAAKKNPDVGADRAADSHLLDRDVTAQRSKDRNNCTTARSAAVGVLTGKVIRQLNRSHWETTPTYMPFQGGIIHEATVEHGHLGRGLGHAHADIAKKRDSDYCKKFIAYSSDIFKNHYEIKSHDTQAQSRFRTLGRFYHP